MALEPVEAARPYAEAAYKHASAAGAEQAWQDLLTSLADAVEGSDLLDRLADPRLDLQQVQAAFAEVVSSLAAGAGAQEGPFKNFCEQLHANGRLEAAGEVAKAYVRLRNAAEKRLEAEIRTAYPIDASTEREVAAKLKEKYGVEEVKLEVTVDEDLVGGMQIIAGDYVIDGSVAAELAQLRTALLR